MVRFSSCLKCSANCNCTSIRPDIRGNTLIRVVNKLPSLNLIEGSVCKVLLRHFLSQPLPPFKGQGALEVVPHDKDWYAQEQGANPLVQHLVEVLYIFGAQGIEEVSRQEIEQHTAQKEGSWW